METMTFAAGLVIRDRYTRAPKGGTTIGGKFYRGGQFCPNALPDDLAALLAPSASPRIARHSIAGYTYAVAPLAIDASIGTAAYALHRIDTNHTYHVHRDNFGEVSCTCPDFTHRRAGSGSMCKHGKAAVELGLIPAPTPRVLIPFASRPAPTARRARFVPSDADFRAAAELFG